MRSRHSAAAAGGDRPKCQSPLFPAPVGGDVDDLSVSSVSLSGVGGGGGSSDDSDDYDSDAVVADEFLRRPSIEAIVMRMTTQPPPLTATAADGSREEGGRK